MVYNTEIINGIKKLQNAVLYDFSFLRINNGRKIKPPKNQILASKYFRDKTGSFEMKILNTNNKSWSTMIITSGLFKYFFISERWFIRSMNQIPVAAINNGSAGVDKDKLPKEMSIDIAKLASIAKNTNR